MIKHGLTRAGAQRFRCAPCDITAVRRRPDNSERRWRRLFLRWVTGKLTVSDIARDAGVSGKTVQRRFGPFWRKPPRSPDGPAARVLVLDGTSVIKREAVALIAGNAETAVPVGWRCVGRECLTTWLPFLVDLKQNGISPDFVVCDAQKGLILAIRTIWPHALIQRCVVHVHRQAMIWLTRSPKTAAGRELRSIVSALLRVRTIRQKRRWIRRFRRWDKRYREFLKERSCGPNGWWYTHRKVRAVRSLLRNAIPNLFRYVRDPGVPRTSNHVEGGLNSRLSELLCSHRGLRKHQRLALVSWFLQQRRLEKTTRSVH